MKRTARSYLHTVRRQIPLRDMRARMMKTLKPACEAFEAEHPDADRTAYYERFGTPQMIAKDALANASPSSVYRAATTKQAITVALFSAIALIGIGLGITYAWVKHELAHPSVSEYRTEPVETWYDTEGNIIYRSEP